MSVMRRTGRGGGSGLFGRFSHVTVHVTQNALLDLLLDQIVGDLAILEPELLVIETRQLVFDLLLALGDLARRAKYVHAFGRLVEIHAYLGKHLTQVVQIRGLLEKVDLVRLEMRDRLGRGHRAVLDFDVIFGQRVLDELREHRLGTRSMLLCCQLLCFCFVVRRRINFKLTNLFVLNHQL